MSKKNKFAVPTLAQIEADFRNNNYVDLTHVGKHDEKCEEDAAIAQELLPHWTDLEAPKKIANPYRKGRYTIKKKLQLKPAVVSREKPLTKYELYKKSQEMQKIKAAKEAHMKILKWKKIGKQPDIRMVMGVHLKWSELCSDIQR